MKILTRDGLDVTDAASRGSKTKEQRNHAHLMRIIKACDSCRRKKIRCDPSHRGRGGATPHPPPQPAGSRRAARSKKPPSRSPSRPSETVGNAFPAAPFALDLSSHFDALDALDALDPVAAALAGGPWDDSTQFPPVDAIQDYGFSLGPDYYYLGSQSCTSSSALSFQASTPQSARERGPPPGVDTAIRQPASQTASSSHLFLDPPASSFDYTDFDLFSPESIFLEDDRMLSLGSSSSSAGPVSSEYGQAAFDDWSTDSTLCRTTGDAADGYRGPSVAGSSDRHVFPPGASSTSPDPLGGQVVICCPPGTMVLTAGGHDGHALDHVRFRSSIPSFVFGRRLTFEKASTSFNGSGSAAAAAYSSVRAVYAMLYVLGPRLTLQKRARQLNMPLEDLPTTRPSAPLPSFTLYVSTSTSSVAEQRLICFAKRNPLPECPLEVAWLQHPRVFQGTLLHL